ncbi:MAG: NADH-quinone oxidoreductase subunit NuoE [Anaerolineae bacterium]|nr:NADH-quinone oxidoreductase subunit NuoE [Anaerolineae bacterium]
MLTDKSKEEIRRIRGEYPDPDSALLPALYLAQKDYGGWLPEEAIDAVAEIMELAPARVGAMASFYTLFQRQPVGRHVIYVCTNVACSLLGAEHLLEYLGHKLGVEPGETSADGRFTLVEVECLGSCGTAPMMQVDEHYFENLTEEKIDRILAELA